MWHNFHFWFTHQVLLWIPPPLFPPLHHHHHHHHHQEKKEENFLTDSLYRPEAVSHKNIKTRTMKSIFIMIKFFVMLNAVEI